MKNKMSSEGKAWLVYSVFFFVLYMVGFCFTTGVFGG